MFSITKDKIDQYAGLILLKKIIQEGQQYSVVLPSEVESLKEVFRKLYASDYIELNSNNFYTPTEKGRKAYTNFMNRYSEFIRVYDIYGAVDLTEGEFAMSSLLNCETADEWDNFFDEEWDDFIDDERWEDVIWAVLGYKNSIAKDQVDIIEMSFMTYLREDRFDTEGTAWAFSIQNELIWDEMLENLNSQLTWEALGDEDVVEDIIEQGTSLLIELYEKEDSFEEEVEIPSADLGGFYYDGNDDDGEVTYVTEEVVEVVEVDYYHNYYDPFYVSPFFVGAILLF